MKRKTFLKKNIPKIIAIFGIAFMLMFINMNKIFAQESENLVIVKSYDLEEGYIYLYEYGTDTLYKSILYDKIYDSVQVVPIIYNKQNIPMIFRIGDILKVVHETTTYIVVDFVGSEQNNFEYISIDEMYINREGSNFNAMYIGNGINAGNQEVLYFVDSEMNYYEMTKTMFLGWYDGYYDLSGKYDIDKAIVVGLDLGNIYTFRPEIGVTIPYWSNSISYELGLGLGLKELEENISEAYNLGKADGMKELEFIKEQYRAIGRADMANKIQELENKIIAEYQRGLREGKTIGRAESPEYSDGYNDAIKDIDAVSKIVPSAIGSIGLFIMTILNVEILGLSLWSILAIFALAGIVIFILRLVL